MIQNLSNFSTALASAWCSSPAALANRITDGKFQRPPHINLVNRRLVDVAFGRCPLSIVQLPFRHGKSTLINHWFPVWLLKLFPHWLIMLICYGDEFSAEWGRKVRNTINENSGLLGITLSQDSQAAGRWNTPQGGGMFCGGIGSGMGRGPQILLFDDLIKDEAVAHSAVYRDRIWDFMVSTAMSRLEPGGAAIVSNARWHEDDHIGRIQRGEMGSKWENIRLPALAEPNDPLGRKVGEALWPERFPAEKLNEIRLRSEYYWLANWQQSPPSIGGDLAYGSFDATEGRNVDSNVRLVDEIPLQLAIDFNRNPGMHGVVGQYFPHEELATARHVLHSPRMTIKQMIGRIPGSDAPYPGSLLELVKRTGGWRWPHLEVFGDATGVISQIGDGKKYWDIVTEELAAAGIPYRLKVPRSNPGVVDSLLAINNAFCTPDGRYRYKVHPDCTALIRDFKNVKADGDGLSKKDELLSHACLAAGTLVETSDGQRPIEEINVGDLVVTRVGLRPVIRAWQSSPAAKTLTVLASNGTKLICTKNHPIWVKNKGFVFAGELKIGDELDILYRSVSDSECKEKQSSIAGSSTPAIPIRNTGHHAPTTADIPVAIEKSDCTGGFTKTTLGRFRQTITSIIGTITRSTISRIICRRFMGGNIAGCIPADRSMLQRLNRHCLPLESRRLYGTRVKRGGQWRSDWLSRLDLAITRLIGNVAVADGTLSVSKGGIAMSFVRTIAGSRPEENVATITKSENAPPAGKISRSINIGKPFAAPTFVEALTENPKTQPVYDLTVEDAHEFYANGILVKNSDAERYRIFWLMPIRRQREFGGGRVTTAEDLTAA